MTRRAMVTLAALLAVLGVLLTPTASPAAPQVQSTGQLAVAGPAPVSAQVQLPPGLGNLRSILTRIFESLTSLIPNVANILRPIFNSILQNLFGGGCLPPFCASP